MQDGLTVQPSCIIYKEQESLWGLYVSFEFSHIIIGRLKSVFQLAKMLRRHACLTTEISTKMGGIGKAESDGYLLDCQIGITQQLGGIVYLGLINQGTGRLAGNHMAN